MAKAPVKAAVKAVVVSSFDPFKHLNKDLDHLEKAVGLTSLSVTQKEDKLDTGVLCLNLLTAGGLHGYGWYTYYGREQSAKTTLAITVAGNVVDVKAFKGILAIFDYEGSFDANYANNMWQYRSNGKSDTAEHLFGIKDADGKYTVEPRIRYYAPSVGEDFFDWLANLLKKLPSIYLMDGEYWYVFPHTKENIARFKGEYDTKYLREFNKIRFRAPDGLPQAIVITDSYPAMCPRGVDMKEEGDAGLAVQARMFAEGLKRVKGRMREKRVLVFGINQVRDIPAVRHGPTEQEACGNAVRFYSDCRFRMTAISVPHATGAMEEEPTISGEGVDVYRYIKCHSYKNKLGGPQKAEMILRLYVSDENGEGKGFDRVWDCYTYLKETGQVGGTRAKIKFLATPLAGKTLSWWDLKCFVDGDTAMVRNLCKKAGIKPFRLFEWCRRQSTSGEGYDLYMARRKELQTKKRGKSSTGAEDEE